MEHQFLVSSLPSLIREVKKMHSSLKKVLIRFRNALNSVLGNIGKNKKYNLYVFSYSRVKIINNYSLPSLKCLYALETHFLAFSFFPKSKLFFPKHDFSFPKCQRFFPKLTHTP